MQTQAEHDWTEFRAACKGTAHWPDSFRLALPGMAHQHIQIYLGFIRIQPEHHQPEEFHVFLNPGTRKIFPPNRRFPKGRIDDEEDGGEFPTPFRLSYEEARHVASRLHEEFSQPDPQKRILTVTDLRKFIRGEIQ